MKLHVIDKEFQFQKYLSNVTLLFSLFKFFIQNKRFAWKQHLNTISPRCLDWFRPIIPTFVGFCSNLIIEITTVELKGLRNYVLRIIRVWSLFFSMQVYMGLHFLRNIWETNISPFPVCYVFCVFWALSSTSYL